MPCPGDGCRAQVGWMPCPEDACRARGMDAVPGGCLPSPGDSVAEDQHCRAGPRVAPTRGRGGAGRGARPQRAARGPARQRLPPPRHHVAAGHGAAAGRGGRTGSEPEGAAGPRGSGVAAGPAEHHPRTGSLWQLLPPPARRVGVRGHARTHSAGAAAPGASRVSLPRGSSSVAARWLRLSRRGCVPAAGGGGARRGTRCSGASPPPPRVSGTPGPALPDPRQREGPSERHAGDAESRGSPLAPPRPGVGMCQGHPGTPYCTLRRRSVRDAGSAVGRVARVRVT